MKMVFKNKTNTPYPTDKIMVEDLVIVNGLIGVIDFIGAEQIALIDENEIMHRFRFLDMEEVFILDSAFNIHRTSETLLVKPVYWMEVKNELLNQNN